MDWHLDSLIWDHTQKISSKSELNEFHSEVSFSQQLRRWGPPKLLILCIPGLYVVLGLGLAWYFNRILSALFTPFSIVVIVNTILAGYTILWLDRTGLKTINRIRPAFAMPDAEYYRLMGWMVERLYEPLPSSPRPAGQKVHWPTVGCFIGGIVGFILLPVLMFPEWLSNLIGLEWGSLPIEVKFYFILGLVLANGIGVLTSWVVVVGAVYMGYRVRDVRVNLDITRSRDNLGLAPYADLALRALLLYLLAYCATTFIALRNMDPFFFTVVLIMSFLPVIGFIGSQYGLHVAIQRSKEERLQKLRDEFSDDIGRWFEFTPPEPNEKQYDPTDISQFIAAKQAIEDLPDWPMNMGSILQLTSATATANVWVVLQLIGFLE